jgi:hypothetical protein
MMVWQSSTRWHIVLAVFFFLLEHRSVDSFPTGAGSCVAEGPAVGGAHLEAATVLKPSNLASGKFDVLVNGKSLIDGLSAPVYSTDQWLSVEVVSKLHLFKGALLRVSAVGSNSLVLVEGENSGPAFACDEFDGVDGITHTDATEKRKMSGILSVAPTTEYVRLDVTLVVTANRVISLYFYQSFDLNFTSPVIFAPTSSPAVDETVVPRVYPTQFPTLSSTTSPTTSAINSAEEPIDVNSAEEPIDVNSAEEHTDVNSYMVTNIQIDLLNVTSMNVHEVLTWESLTSEWFVDYYATRGGPVAIESTLIWFKSSTPIELDSSTHALRVVYDQVLHYGAASQDFINVTRSATPEELVALPFESAEWNAVYIQRLNSNAHFAPNLVTMGGPIDAPVVLGEPVAKTHNRTLAHGIIALLVVLCCALIMYASYRTVKENRGGLKVRDYAPDTFSFIGSETSRRFGE